MTKLTKEKAEMQHKKRLNELMKLLFKPNFERYKKRIIQLNEQIGQYENERELKYTYQFS